MLMNVRPLLRSVPTRAQITWAPISVLVNQDTDLKSMALDVVVNIINMMHIIDYVEIPWHDFATLLSSF